MNYLLRFQLYDNPSRQSFAQLGSDQWIEKHPEFIYGLPYRLEPDEFGSIGKPGQVYVLANPLRYKPIQDPANPKRRRLQIDVFLARLEEWGWFEEAPEVRKNGPNRKQFYPTKPGQW
ncbi:hypothetical protein GO730_08830 [Spirosoma sp. HMF3257]|uniref:Uncharacterized protein n=1 Tax=Spirosoma telluris TaxID=2183553 RepID=A0A327NHQ7_9BACT|nr:hypothetical protein [Spirosoma telluris]RAI74363.1 hypothetical protein HMF3257_08745 [Spirosoma telluris]